MTCCPVCGSAIEGNPVILYRDRGMVVAGGSFALLTRHEMDVLQVLADQFPRTVSAERILASVYQLSDKDPEIKIIDVYICKIRKKLKAVGVRIDTAWGRGYALGLDKKPVTIEVLDDGVEQ